VATSNGATDFEAEFSALPTSHVNHVRDVAANNNNNHVRDVAEQLHGHNSFSQTLGANDFSRFGQCGRRNAHGVNGRINTPLAELAEGDTEFGEYPWQVAILKKEQYDNVYVCGGSLIDGSHLLTAAHCIKVYRPEELRIRLGEWDVNNDSEFYPNIELDVLAINIHPDYYPGNLYNDLALIKLDGFVDFARNPHISPVCLPDVFQEFEGHRCWVTGWGKDAFGKGGNYQNVLKEVDVPILSHVDCERKLRRTRLGGDFVLHPGFVCAGGEEGKDACKVNLPLG
jgi:secreted trypsin-like serine protease